MSEINEDVTALLKDVSDGKSAAWNRLLDLVYRELHTMARGTMKSARPGQTLQTTALVHEAYMRLVRDKDERWNNRTHFFGVAAKAMRQILVDRYRRWMAQKRGKGKAAVSLDHVGGLVRDPDDKVARFHDLEALDRALSKLEKNPENQRKCTVVEMRFFVGLSYKETAKVMGISQATVLRDWSYTRAWLFQEMQGAKPDDLE